MRFGLLTKLAAVTISLNSVWYQRCSCDEVRFIRQPQKQVQAEVQGAEQPSQEAHPRLADAAPAAQAGIASREPELTETKFPELQLQTAEPQQGQGLKWVGRESLSSPRTMVRDIGPLSIANPNYREPSAKWAAPDPPSVPVASPQISQAVPTQVEKPAAEVPVEPAESSRSRLASLVSSRIFASRPSAAGGSREVESLEPPPGWQAVGQELSRRLARCEALLNRHAYFSAREDAEAAMLHLVRVLDLMTNSYHSEPAWRAAQRALIEAEDFSTTQRLTSDSGFVRRIILSHETPVLKDADVSLLVPMAAAQHYRQYAENKLAEAAQGHPWASEVITALGRTYQSQADLSEDGTEMQLRWRAITLYRGARRINPSNALAANQLGFILLQMDRPVEARGELIASLNAATSISALENMIEASRRLNDIAMADWALQQHAALKAGMPAGPQVPEVLEVDVRTFAAVSPYTIGPAPPNTPGASPTTRLSTHPAAAPANY